MAIFNLPPTLGHPCFYGRGHTGPGLITKNTNVQANNRWTSPKISVTGKSLLDQNDILTGRLVHFIAERSATVNTNILVFVSLGQDKEEVFFNRNSLFTLGTIESCCLKLIETTFWCERTGEKIHEFNSLRF